MTEPRKGPSHGRVDHLQGTLTGILESPIMQILEMVKIVVFSSTSLHLTAVGMMRAALIYFLSFAPSVMAQHARR
jgi:hypothetical protein